MGTVGRLSMSQTVASSEPSTKRAFAHVRQNDDGSFAIHDLEEHLRVAATLAGEYASRFGASDWRQLAGLWHDLGKYFLTFQNHIARRSEFNLWAH